MSDVPFFPKEEGNSSSSGQAQEEKPHFKRPEFILIDGRDGKNKYTYFDTSQQSQGSFRTEKEAKQFSKGAISLRFICMLGFVFCLVFGLGMLLWSIVMTLFATLSLFQNQNLNQSMRSFWKIFVNTVIAGFGFTLGMMSPTLGLGLLALYFSLTGHLVEDDLLRKVIRRSFNHL
jgi:Fe2+ transport system protein B